MSFQLVGLAAFLFAAGCAAQSSSLSDWPKLLEKKDTQAAKKLCTRYAGSTILAKKVKAQKCLANVALSGNEIILLDRNAAGGPLQRGYKPEAVDEALVHLNLALKLAPQDLAIHQDRLHVLEVAARYSDMPKTLDESCTIYRGKAAPNAWLGYAPELNQLGQYDTALEFMKVLDKHYPNTPDIVGNIGAFLSLLKRDKEAIPYLKKAADLAPKDPVNAWNLARAYDLDDQIKSADKWYQAALSLPSDQKQHKESACIYAQFVEMRLKQRDRACQLEKADCPPEAQTACQAPSDTTAKPK